MRKIKLLLLLVLLCVGVSESWAVTTKYTVVWDKTLPDAGYELTSTDGSYGSYYFSITSGGGTSEITVTESNKYDMLRFFLYEYLDIDDYFKPIAKTGYSTSVWINPNDARIYIGYTYSGSDAFTWTDGDLEYSNVYTSSSYCTRKLPDGEVAVRLALKDKTTVTDTIAYSASDGYVYNGNNDRLYTNYVGLVTRNVSDDDNDGQGSYATYTYLGQLNWNLGEEDHYFLRQHQIKYSTAKNVTVKGIVKKTTGDHQGEYKVTAIQRYGFCYKANDSTPRSYCLSDYHYTGRSSDYDITKTKTRGDTEIGYFEKDYYDHANINNHRNYFLESITFEDCNITDIGDYAFMSCKKLTSFEMPKTVVNLGQGTFECCTALTSFLFQKNMDDLENYPDGYTHIKTIRNFTFWFCTALRTLELPDGIETIEGQSYGASMQYMLSLKNLRLPNTLKTIGEHFLCCALSIETLTIPASVTYIDGACFHGCENLSSVYLLGSAATLIAGESGMNTFGENGAFCGNHVNNCDFYTTEDYIKEYASDDVWKGIAENRDGGYLVDADGNEIKDSDGNSIPVSGSVDNYSNHLYVISDEIRKFTGGKWVTACFPNGMEDYKTDATNKLGSNARVAEMISAVAVNHDPYVYHLTFKLISGTKIPEGKPFLVCPSKDSEIKLYDTSELNQNKEEYTNPHITTINADNGALIQMISYYLENPLYPGDFYFISTGNDGVTEGKEVVGNFKKVGSSAPTIAPCRAYWKITFDGVKDVSAKTAMVMSDFWGDTDGIENTEKDIKIVIDGIYDTDGRKLNLDYDALGKGLYIVNGKKVVKK